MYLHIGIEEISHTSEKNIFPPVGKKSVKTSCRGRETAGQKTSADSPEIPGNYIAD